MRSLTTWCAGTIAWQFALPNLGRLYAPLEVGLYTSAFAAAAALAMLLTPSFRRTRPHWLALALVGSFCAVRWLTTGPSALPVATALAECVGVGVAVFLATGLRRQLGISRKVIDELGDPGPYADSFENGQQEIFREIRRARRYERPLSLLAIGAEAPLSTTAIEHLIEDLRRDAMGRVANSRVAKLLLEETGGSDVVTRRGEHFLLLLPETDAQGASLVGQRLARAAARRWGLDLHCGISSFPDKEVTFDGLILEAESQMRGEDGEPLSVASERRRGGPSSGPEAAPAKASAGTHITSSPQPGT
jgi:GGDEF domain-containing protein